jgi:hypothetical protein
MRNMKELTIPGIRSNGGWFSGKYGGKKQCMMSFADFYT